MSSHVVTVQLPTRCLVDKFLHKPCVSDVVTVQCHSVEDIENSDYIVTVVVIVPSK